jgi:hypothetical protein
VKTSITEAEKQEMLERLTDPVWRLNNLYRIVNKFGREVQFVPTAEQAAIIHAVYVLKQKRHAILKARQLGFSTLIAIMMLDAVYFGENTQASVVDQTQAHASAKLAKVRFAYEKLGALKERLKEDNNSTIRFPNGGSINAGLKARGGTNQWLHISEWGPIAHDDPSRSEEIKTGALPTAEHGNIFVETTFKGGKGGHLYELLKTAMETPEEHRTEKDFRFWFFPWYLDKGYTLEGDYAAVSPTTRQYLAEKEKELGITFTKGQALWYQKTKQEQGIFMLREYPTTPEEAFKAPIDGAIYGDVISELRAKGHIRPYEYDRGCPVFAIWDLGWADSTSIWLVQIIGHDIHWIWHTRQERRTAAEMVSILDKTGIAVAAHYLPHDAGSADAKEGKTYKDALTKAGLVNLVTVPRTTNIWAGINSLRDILKRSWFCLPFTAQGIEALEAYHTKDTSAGGTITKEPVHDWSSHDSDAARIFAEALELGLVRSAAAKAVMNPAPRYPDGSLVSIETVRQVRQRNRQQTAMSGHSPFR